MIYINWKRRVVLAMLAEIKHAIEAVKRIELPRRIQTRICSLIKAHEEPKTFSPPKQYTHQLHCQVHRDGKIRDVWFQILIGDLFKNEVSLVPIDYGTIDLSRDELDKIIMSQDEFYRFLGSQVKEWESQFSVNAKPLLQSLIDENILETHEYSDCKECCGFVMDGTCTECGEPGARFSDPGTAYLEINYSRGKNYHQWVDSLGGDVA